jgi:hypothetical protein
MTIASIPKSNLSEGVEILPSALLLRLGLIYLYNTDFTLCQAYEWTNLNFCVHKYHVFMASSSLENQKPSSFLNPAFEKRMDP